MTVSLSVEPRAKVLSSNSKSVNHIAGVVYGPKFVSTKVQIDKKEFDKTFKQVGESTVVVLNGLDKPVSVLIKDVVFSPIKGGIVHVDFYAPEMDKEVTTHVPLHFINESPAVKEGAVIDKVMHEVTVSCKPETLPSHIDVDLSLLTTAGTKLHISELTFPNGVVCKHDGSEVVVVAEHGRVEKVEEVETNEVVNQPENKTE
jgi:large subunit ribosomal protein L25